MSEKRCKVIHLPAGKRDEVNIFVGTNEKLYYHSGTLHTNGQHLYILSTDSVSEEKLQEGKSKLMWGLGSYNSIYTYSKGGEVDMMLKKCKHDEFHLILATTNKTLGLPEIDQEFIKEYCLKGGIEDVLAHFDEYTRFRNSVTNSIYEGGSHYTETLLRVNEGKISLKQSWDEKELLLLMQQYGDYVSNKVNASGKPHYKSSYEWYNSTKLS